MVYSPNKSVSLLDKLTKISFLLNILTTCFAIAYYIIPSYNILFDVFGFILLLAFFLNIALIWTVDNKLIKNTVIGKKLNRMDYYYALFFIIGILLMIIGVFLLSFLIEGELLFILLILTGLLMITVFGGYFSILIRNNIDKRGVWQN